MTQAPPTIGANKPGILYRQEDNDGKKALMSHHKGSVEPDYAEAGTIWLDDSATPWVLKIFDGAVWISMADVNSGDGTFHSYSGTSVSAQVDYGESPVVAAATTDLGALDTNTVLVTGSGAITSLGSSASELTPLYNVRFGGAMTLTYDASALILPGAANIVTAAGDAALFLYLGSGNWRCVSYHRASGAALYSPYSNGASGLVAESVQEAVDELAATGWRVLGNASVSAAAAVDFTSDIGAACRDYCILVHDLVPSTNTADLCLRISTDGGSTWKSGASDYKYARLASVSAAVAADAGSNGDTSMVLFANLGNASAEAGRFEIHFSGPSNASLRKYFYGMGSYDLGNSNSCVTSSHGMYVGGAQAINAVRILASTGTLTGKFTLLGRKL